MKQWPISIAAVGVAAVAGTAASGLRPHVEAPAVPQGLDSQESVAGATLLGQFRTSFSSWMWVRTDLYLHNGVSMRMLSSHEMKAGLKGVGGADDGTEHDLHDDSMLVTVVPEPARDFRGVFGDIDRTTKAWKDMRGHGHNDPKAALPLFRLMTWFDPHFIPGFSVGAAVLARDRDDVATQKAMQLLHEGLKHNPESVTLLADLGRYTITRRHDLTAAEPTLKAAVLAGIKNRARLPESELDGLRDAFRWLSLTYRDLGRIGDMIQVATLGVQTFPDDVVLKRHMDPVPSILRPQFHKQWYAKNLGLPEGTDEPDPVSPSTGEPTAPPGHP